MKRRINNSKPNAKRAGQGARLNTSLKIAELASSLRFADDNTPKGFRSHSPGLPGLPGYPGCDTRTNTNPERVALAGEPIHPAGQPWAMLRNASSVAVRTLAKGGRRAGQAPRLNTNTSNRRGSVLIVVIGLLLVMMLTGIAFFTFASQEHSSAEFYADSAKVFSVTPNADPLFDWALEQLIIGPHDNNKQSVLWPGQNSLVPNMLGLFAANPNDSTQPTVPTDRQPYNGGRGIHIISGSNGQPILDQDFDGGTPGNDNNNALFAINWSPTTGSTMGFGYTSRAQFFNTSWLPARDVGYTYPDINNIYLAHIGNLSIGAAGSPNAGVTITNYIPSFHRPQYLRDPTTGVPFTDWQTNQSGSFAGHDTTARVLRPHPAHLWVDQNGNPVVVPAAGPNNVTRYLQTASVVPGSNPLHTVQPFGGATLLFKTDPNGNGIYGEQGIWSNSFGAGALS